MAKPKIIYVHPGDMIEIRVITDKELCKDFQDWKYQVRPESILLQYKRYRSMACADPFVFFDNKFID